MSRGAYPDLPVAAAASMPLIPVFLNLPRCAASEEPIEKQITNRIESIQDPSTPAGETNGQGRGSHPAAVLCRST